jgi:hypothetical protein
VTKFSKISVLIYGKRKETQRRDGESVVSTNDGPIYNPKSQLEVGVSATAVKNYKEMAQLTLLAS